MAVLYIRYCRRTKIVFAVVILFGIVRRASPSSSSEELDPQPSFAEPIGNVSVASGREASLACVVENLGSYRVAWIHTDTYTLISIRDRVITRNSRYVVTNSNHRSWYLHIRYVEEHDSGEYMCQINTTPMMSQIGFLEVVVPPSIDEEETSTDTNVREGNDVALVCVAKGSPNPRIKWRIEDGAEIPAGKQGALVRTVNGMTLNITKVSRLNMGAYLCTASNGVSPSVSKRIFLQVNFPPMIWIPNQLIGMYIGGKVVLNCNLESHPKPVTFWMKDSGHILISNKDYQSIVMSHGLYKDVMQLTIQNIKFEDFGSYKCVAKNSLGETEGTIRLYEIRVPTSLAPYTTQDSHLAKSEKFLNGEKTSLEDMDSEAKVSPSEDYNASRDLQHPYQKGSIEPGRNCCHRVYSNSIVLSSAIFAVVCIIREFAGRRLT